MSRLRKADLSKLVTEIIHILSQEETTHMERRTTTLQASIMKQKVEYLIESREELKRQNHELRMQIEELRIENQSISAEHERIREPEIHPANEAGVPPQEQHNLRQRGKLLLSQLRFGEAAEPQPPRIMDLDEIQELFLCG